MIVGLQVPREEMIKRMEDRCKQAGMLLDQSLIHIGAGTLKGPNTRWYNYYCRKITPSQVESGPEPTAVQTVPRQVGSGPVKSALDSSIEAAQNKCEDLGFIKETEKFGECVLKITK